MKSDVFVVFVNGKKIEDGNVDPEWTLLRYLRRKLRLPGTKFACGEGGCGACTVMVSKVDPESGQIVHFSVNACLAPICSVHGMSVTTTEGIGSTQTRLHPVQERLALAHGSQCGFCTPGFVMSMYTLLRNNPKPTMEQIEDSLVGNLCRCTGYRPILEGFRTFTEEGSQVNGCGRGDCCQLKRNGTVNGQSQNGCKNDQNGEVNGSENGLDLEQTSVLLDAGMFNHYDPSQEIIFPPELKLRPELYSKSLFFQGPRITFYRPVTLKELVDLKSSFPQAKIVTGNTEVGVETRFKNLYFPVIIHPSSVPELMRIEITPTHVEIGAAVSLSTIETEFKKLIRQLPCHETKVVSAVSEMLRWFAGRQIRNVACLGGNIMTGSPISDLNQIFLASGAKLLFKSVDQEREIIFDRNFYTGYRRNIARENEVLTTIKIPLTSENEYFMAYKQSRRKDDDISIVNAAMKATFKPQSLEVTSLSLAFGGMAPTTILAEKTMEKLHGKTWNPQLLEEATSSLLEEMELDPAAPGGMAQYRRALTASFFFKFYLSVQRDLHAKYPSLVSSLDEDVENLLNSFEHIPLRSTQFFQNVPENQEKIDPVGRPVPHLAGKKQTTGEATYIDDLPPFSNELHSALILSTRAYAKILKIDDSKALELEGVHKIIYARDIPGENSWGPVKPDEEFLASTRVVHVGQAIGLVVAEDSEISRRAAKLVEIVYEDLPNPILTIEEAIKSNSLFDKFEMETGDVEEGFRTCDHVLEGETYLGGQEHFYLETNSHVVIPHEGKEIEVISSTQSVTDTQAGVARALGITRNNVTCKAKRIGGAFGGKASRNIGICGAVAVAATNTKRPVRIVLERDDDMVLTGGRHPCLGRWKIGFNNDGKLVSFEVKLYINAGSSLDLSGAVIAEAVLALDGPYRFDNLKATGWPCKTNLPSNTAFRGFGTPQALFIVEMVALGVSEFLNIHPSIVREKNFYQTGDVTPYGQRLGEVSMRKCWDQVICSGEFKQREKRVEEFNRQNRFIKRGISAVPCKFNVAFEIPFLNQAGVLLLVYTDGSVLLSHGGMEMGQGIHTKMAQVASRALNIPMENILIAETSSDKVPNTSPSAASSTADLNGMAVLNACQELQNRLAPYKKKMPDGKWVDWVTAAYFDRVSLSVFGYYKTPDLEEINPVTKKGNPFNYFTFGAAISEVEVDCLTGDHKLLRTDIVMDVGTSLNPAIDIGQVEGAFTQGRGLFTLEQLVYSSSGSLLSRGPGSYKIPSIQDIPREFNVSLLRNSSEPRAVYSSKAVGEPPLFSGASVFFAIREAVKAARKGNGGAEGLHLPSPATAERIRMTCHDYITQQIKSSPSKEFKSWSLDV